MASDTDKGKLVLLIASHGPEHSGDKEGTFRERQKFAIEHIKGVARKIAKAAQLKGLEVVDLQGSDDTSDEDKRYDLTYEGLERLFNKARDALAPNEQELEGASNHIVLFYYFGHGNRVEVPFIERGYRTHEHALTLEYSEGEHLRPAPAMDPTRGYVLAPELTRSLVELEKYAVVIQAIESCYAQGMGKGSSHLHRVAPRMPRARPLDEERLNRILEKPEWEAGARIRRLFLSEAQSKGELNGALAKIMFAVCECLETFGEDSPLSLSKISFGDFAQFCCAARHAWYDSDTIGHGHRFAFTGPTHEPLLRAGDLPEGPPALAFARTSQKDNKKSSLMQPGLWARSSKGSLHRFHVDKQPSKPYKLTITKLESPTDEKIAASSVASQLENSDWRIGLFLPHADSNLHPLELEEEFRTPTSRDDLPCDGYALGATRAGYTLSLQTTKKGRAYVNLFLERSRTSHGTDVRQEPLYLLNQWEPQGISLQNDCIIKVGDHWQNPELPLLSVEELKQPDARAGYTLHIIMSDTPRPYYTKCAPWKSIVPHEIHTAQYKPKAEADWTGELYWRVELSLADWQRRYAQVDALKFSKTTQRRHDYFPGDGDNPLVAHDQVQRSANKPNRAVMLVHRRLDDLGAPYLLTLIAASAGKPHALHHREVKSRYLYREDLELLIAITRHTDNSMDSWPMSGGHAISEWLGAEAVHLLCKDSNAIDLWVEDRRELCPFLDAPWETLTLNDSSILFDSAAGREVVRRVFRPWCTKIENVEPGILRVLFFCGAPGSPAEEILDAEELALAEVNRASRDRLMLNVELEGTLAGLEAQLDGLHRNGTPACVVHLSCHGLIDREDGSWLGVLEDRRQRTKPPPEDPRVIDDLLDERRYATMTIADLEQAHPMRGKVVVLSACDSATVGWSDAAQSLVAAGADAVLGWSGTVSDVAASTFSTAFYQMLVHGETLLRAVKQARIRLRAIAPLEAHRLRFYLAPERDEEPLVAPSSRSHQEVEDDSSKFGVGRRPRWCPWPIEQRDIIRGCVRLLRDESVKSGVLLLGTTVDAPLFADRLGWSMADFDTIIIEGVDFSDDQSRSLADHLLEQRTGYRPKLVLWVHFEKCRRKNGAIVASLFHRVDMILDAIRRSPTTKAVIADASKSAFEYCFDDGTALVPYEYIQVLWNYPQEQAQNQNQNEHSS